jgi:hypothetical protein
MDFHEELILAFLKMMQATDSLCLLAATDLDLLATIVVS